ncbi:hypothetical protein LZC95_48630 [Pendulispora brunnea]|uniref:Uncharacterized protein n=1 Tax=Pendulispora brunnea TaxID=2905690 RepID=A0ABZ2K9Q8_9BACT
MEVIVPEGTLVHNRTALVFAMAMKDGAFVTVQLVTNESPEATEAHEVARAMSVLHQVAAGR